jgi:sensor histidine kinase YesM
LYIGYRLSQAGDTETVSDLCIYLGDYFRYITYNTNRLIEIDEEIKYTQTYLNIQKLRFEDRLQLEIYIDDSVKKLEIPSLIIQPIVENSFKHGIDRQIRKYIASSYLHIEVEDNGIGMDELKLEMLMESINCDKVTSDNYGLWNINWRLKHQFGNDALLKLENVDNSRGFRTTCIIPLHEIVN